ncbi:TetR/AcrR family transcriptional regulator [Aestuariibius insulae]|uniref:TetR/AcrR family transcriptional regulator n=1 Tax=Aestuariibius insulae TaxID=2058287 RepID=UPI00345EAE97
MGRKTGSHSEITGPRVREAALRLIAQHGFAAVSMRQIAAEVGIQAGALYNYTPDKQSLLFDLMQSHMHELLEAREASRTRGDPLEQLEAFVRFHIRFHLPRQRAVFVSYMELRNLAPDNFSKIEQLRTCYEGELQGILDEGHRLGDFEISDSKITTLAIIAMLTGICNWYREDGRLSAAEIEADYWTLVRKSVGIDAAEPMRHRRAV